MSSISSVKIIECPRDAMQGIKTFIPTEQKAHYLNQLLKVGFDTLDFGSFVSAQAIPQMQDTAAVLEKLDLDDTNTRLLAIIANTRGATLAGEHDEITYLGYPFSVSETFQRRNTNKGIEESLQVLAEIKNICEINGKRLVVYLSMAFGNPYNDFYDYSLVEHWVDRIDEEIEVDIISLADTIGTADPALIGKLFGVLTEDYPHIEFGAHLHSAPHNWREKVEIAYKYGCRRFDGAMKGFGGCPMAKDELVGNLATENLLRFFEQENVPTQLNMDEFLTAMKEAESVFSSIH